MDRLEARRWIEETCGEGWLHLVDSVYDHIGEKYEVTSVYQKWGALRFDISPWDDEIDSFLESISDKSLTTCEVCGANGKESRINDWVHTRCESHHK